MFPYNQIDKLIFVNIKNSYEAMIQNEMSNIMYRNSLYNCTVKYWRIANDKAVSATHILGCYKGKVVEVVRISNVTVATTGSYAGRKIFEGIEEPHSIYMGFDIHLIFDTLVNFNTKYWNL